MILSRRDLLTLIKSNKLVLKPFSEDTVRENGVDLRIGEDVAVLLNNPNPIDPDDLSSIDLSEYYKLFKIDDCFILQPYMKILVSTVEWLKMPDDVAGFVELRSTFARLGLSIPPCLHPATPVITGNGEVKRAGEIRTGLIGVNVEKGALMCSDARRVDSYSSKLIHVKTRNSDILVTPGHGFLAIRRREVVELPAAALEKGDLVAVPLKISAVKVETRSLSWRDAWAAGCIMAGGVEVDVADGRLRVAVTGRVADRLANVLGSGRADDGCLEVGGRDVARIAAMFPELVSGKGVPRLVMISGRKQISGFIAGIFDASGKGGDRIVLRLRDEFTARQVQLLSLRLGFYPRLEHDRGRWRLIVEGVNDCGEFLRSVSRYTVNKIMVEAKPGPGDYVYLTKTVCSALRRVGVKRRRVMRSEVQDIVGELRRLRPRGYRRAVRELRYLARFRWDRVVEVKTLDYRDSVVDFEVPGLHHYLAGPFITHNTIIDAGFEGQITLEVHGGAFPVILRKGMRFAHVVFMRLTGATKPYRGKYQGQRGVTLPR